MTTNKIPREWLPLDTPSREEMTSLWGGDWGCDSEVGFLKAVLLRRPGKEIEGIKDPKLCRWLEVLNPEKARDQHDALAEMYKTFGVSIHYVNTMRADRPNAFFMRDNVLMSPGGAIVGRQAMACRRGEERYAAEALGRLGVPILRTVSGHGIFETACCLWVDAETVILGAGNRANTEGIRQVKEILKQVGVTHFLQMQIPHGYAHIDSIISFIGKKTAMIDPLRFPVEVGKEKGLTLLEAPSSEETANLALNFVTLSPGVILLASGFPETKSVLTKTGFQVIEIDVSELRKGWGSLHCMTAVLKRQPVGLP